MLAALASNHRHARAMPAPGMSFINFETGVPMRTALLMSIAVYVLFATIASAQNPRSAVSVAGVDTNSCTVALPCRTFSVAMSHTNAGGEIIAVDSAGYGPFTVDRSVTVLGAPGVYAGITAPSGAGIFINSPGGKVVLRNLYVNGSGTGDAGISVTGAADETNIEGCVITGFTNYGIFAWFNVRVSDTTIRNCGYGIWIDNSGALVKGSIDRTRIAGIQGGTDPNDTGVGIMSLRNATVSVRDSVVGDAQTGMRISNGGQLVAENSMVTGCSIGIQSDSSGFGRISNNVLTGNSTALKCLAGSTIGTWSNNKIRGNATDIDNTGTISVFTQD
jgi:parallel beta helix pectate lyase-like protein